jgi:hypothetical protein
MYPNSSYQDGLSQVVTLFVYNYNNGATYTTYSGDPSEGAQVNEARNSDNQLIGSVTFVDGRKGTLNCQYELIADELPGAANMMRPGHIVAFRQRFYVVGPMKVPIEKNGIIKFSAEITELQNPFVPGLLSTLGQQKFVSIASASLPTTADASASGTRSGATVGYTLESFATEGSAAPSGITINASTGLITVANTVLAGTYDVRAIATDTKAKPESGTDVRKGWGRYTITVT